MLNIQLFETSLYQIINWFFIYSFIGWLIECIVISYENKHFTNRGFIHGPFCIIYGFGALIFYFLLKPLAYNYLLLFFGGLLVATLLEYITAQLMIRVFGAFWWDYSKKPYNYKGILCLESSIAWGVLTICLFGFVHKFVSGVVARYPVNLAKTTAVVLLIYLAFDFFYTLRHTLKEGENALPENSVMMDSE